MAELEAPGAGFVNIVEPWTFLKQSTFPHAMSRRERVCLATDIRIWRLGFRKTTRTLATPQSTEETE